MKTIDKLFTFIQSNVLHTLNYRPMDKFLKKHFNNSKGLIGLEIGTLDGAHACDMLHHLPIEKMYLIDPYEEYEEYNLTHDYNACFLNAKKCLRRFNDKVNFIRKYSEEAIKEFEDKSLDFVYIDGNHAYEYVKKDIELYYKKVKIGGVIGGHDFGCHYPGVPRAVLEFTDKKKLELLGDQDDWWVIKK